MTTQPDSDLLPIQEAAKRFNVSLASLHKYAALGRIKKYRKAFDRVTYVDSRQIADLSTPATTMSFVVDLPINPDSSLLKRVVMALRSRSPERAWQLAGWSSFALGRGQRTHPYTALKYKARDQREVVGELREILDEVDPSGRLIDRARVTLKAFPFAQPDLT